MLKTFVPQLSKELKLESAVTSPGPGVYTLSLDVQPVTIAEIPNGFTLRTIIAPFPKNNQEENFASLVMRANLFGPHSNGTILGLTDDTHNLIVTRAIDYQVDYSQFKVILEEFLNFADFWREETNKTSTRR